MRQAYTTIREEAQAELVIKKSRFICRLFPVESETSAQAILAQCKKRWWDASHNCSAMLVGTAGEYSHCSDDGEPQGTAGMPMLLALKGAGLTNVLAVVTRYFGGVLLGTGGLTRAYAEAVQAAVKAAIKVRYQPCTVFETTLSFRLWGKASAQLTAAGFTMGRVSYGEQVTVELFCDEGREAALETLVSALTSGSAVLKKMQQKYRTVEQMEKL